MGRENNPFNLIREVKAKAGDILRIAPRYFILVVSEDRHNNKTRHDFYYVRCNSKGVIEQRKWDLNFENDDYSAANYINHSNMIGVSDCTKIERVGHIKLKQWTVFHNCQKYQWWTTGIKKIDAYLSNVDARWGLFYDASTDVEMRDYRRDEDRNYHSENGSKVEQFAFLFYLRRSRDANLMKLRRKYQGVSK